MINKKKILKDLVGYWKSEDNTYNGIFFELIIDEKSIATNDANGITLIIDKSKSSANIFFINDILLIANNNLHGIITIVDENHIHIFNSVDYYKSKDKIINNFFINLSKKREV